MIVVEKLLALTMESKCPTLQQISGKIEDKLHHNSIERNS
jgi:hypothetical protein